MGEARFAHCGVSARRGPEVATLSHLLISLYRAERKASQFRSAEGQVFRVDTSSFLTSVSLHLICLLLHPCSLVSTPLPLFRKLILLSTTSGPSTFNTCTPHSHKMSCLVSWNTQHLGLCSNAHRASPLLNFCQFRIGENERQKRSVGSYTQAWPGKGVILSHVQDQDPQNP